MTIDTNARLFSYSSAQMAVATRYARWTCDLFRQYVTGEVLEVGCGVGVYTAQMLERPSFDKLLSIDRSSEAIEYCRSRLAHPGLEFACLDVMQVRQSFNTIICMNVLEHIHDDKAVLRHLYDLLKPGGILFLLVPAHPLLFTSWDRHTGHVRRYNKGSLKRLVADAISGRQFHLKQFYFNSLGALGYVLVYRFFRKNPAESVEAQIGLFDKLIVPLMRRLEGRWLPFGLSLVSILQK